MLRLSLFFWFFVCSNLFADKHYCLLFSQDSYPVSLPFRSHVFGTFIQVDDKGNLKKAVTISWAPKNDWRITDRPQEGYNMDLLYTINTAIDDKKKITLSGPFEISPSFFKRAEEQYARPGKYKCIDALSRRKSPAAVNCIHRVSDISGERLVTHVLWGKKATEKIVKFFRKKNLLKDTSEGERITQILGIDKFPIQKR